MQETDTDIETVRIIHGRPWKDAVIKILEPRSPYRPWTVAGGVEPGDALAIVLDTEPVSVLTGVGIVAADGDVDNAIAEIDSSGGIGLLELGTLNILADFVLRPSRETVYHYRSPQRIVDTIGSYGRSTVEAMLGHTSLAAGRVLLASGGRCAACREGLDLTADDARDRVHIRTVDVDLEDLEDDPADWPAALCNSCFTRMRRDGFTNFVDFRFALHPACPNCGARRSMSAVYGYLVRPLEEPWRRGMGCVVIEPRAEWVCGRCGHEW